MNKDPDTKSRMLRGRSKVIAFVSAVVIFVVSTIASLSISFSNESKTHNVNALVTTQQINEKIALAVGTLHSMGAVHQASDAGFKQTQFELFSTNLVSSQSGITATGRFDAISHEDLDLFKSENQNHGLFEFSPKSFSVDGSITEIDPKSQYRLLVAFFPKDPVSANFIGLDLSEITGTNNAIATSIDRNKPAPAKLPNSWFSNGQLNIFSSTYFGHYVPETVEDRNLQTDGGYFITLDLGQILQEATGKEYPLSAEVRLSSNNRFSKKSGKKSDSLVSQDTQLVSRRIASGFFKTKPIFHNLRIGTEVATIAYRIPHGVTQSDFISALGAGLVALFAFLIAASIRTAYRVIRKQAIANKKALWREKERALATLNSLQDAVITTDSDDNIDYLNPAMLNALNTDRKELIGLPVQSIMDKYFSDEESNKNPDDKKQEIKTSNTLKKLNNNNADSIVFDYQATAMVDQNRQKIGSVLTMHDISKEHALTNKLAHQATHDALTGLPNRRKFESTLRNLLRHDNPGDLSCYVVGYIDLDQFKLVNDTVGHAAGDLLLKKIATDLTDAIPKDIEIARLGGDEFGFLSSACYSNGAEDVANLFHNLFQSYFYQSDDTVFSIRASIGLTTIKPYHITINDVLSEVDIACYTAKDAGRNGYVIYDSEDAETKQRQGEMLYLPMLQSALKDNRFVIYTQPIVSTDPAKASTTHHYECLLRLIDEDGSIVTPYKFIVAAERYDLIRDIDRWVLKNVFSQLAQFKGTHLEDTRFSINLSGHSAVDPAMPDFIYSMLLHYSIEPSNICFELTETAVISNFSQAQRLIKFLRNKGCTIALDDFGAGASSFGYLKNLEVDYLKIDGQFVKEITSNKVDLEMVRSMNNVGGVLGIKTIAEFVETKEIMDALGAINVDYAQGYYISKPTPMADLLDDNQSRAAA